ncbi:MAG: cysteine--tRNA ligase [Candidatus Nitrosocaldaceae archaeon]|nr:MAG: cysteine--tRNA ligase [Candidatus Nitrosocaldaceae archaeon]
MKIYNTLTKQLEEIKNKNVNIYLCGVTVYDYSHIGHARTIIVFDVLRRYLMYKGYNVRFIQNFTDVDDKIINAAKEQGIKPLELANRFIEQYFKDFDRLNVLRADLYPRATEHIDDIIKLIQGLIEKGYAYVTSKGVYFHVPKDEDYGKLSKKDVNELIAGARIEVDPEKKSPLDFALWKFSDEEPSWDSPWGRGRPGWHIECSAMSLKYLEHIDIHGGGEDLIFPHHENEIAQSESYTCKEFARIWMHVGMLTIRGEKMSKSLKNIEPINQALKKYGANPIRLYCLSAHYRKQLDYDYELLEQAVSRWRDIEHAGFELKFADEEGEAYDAKEVASNAMKMFDDAMSNDLDTPNALHALNELVKYINKHASKEALNKSIADAVKDEYNTMLSILGFKLLDVSKEEKEEIYRLIEERNRLRREKRFKEADAIREKLRMKGIELIDHKKKTIWKKLDLGILY